MTVKIRLVEPKPAGINVFDISPQPRLGLPLIGRMLADQGHDVRIYAEMVAPIDWADLESADLVGFSTLTNTAPIAYKMAERVRSKGIPVVIGGPHVTFLPDEGLEQADFVARGEGQFTALELVEALERGGGFEHIRGLSFRGPDGQVVHNPPRPNCTQAEFEALPAPDLRLIKGWNPRRFSTPIVTQWGCPFNCEFCAVIAVFGRTVRKRSVESVLDELEAADAPLVFFCDDNFVVSKQRTRQLLEGLIERGLRIQWSAQARAESVYKHKDTREIDHDFLQLMRDSGCVAVHCGFESVNERTLEAYHKQQTVQTILDAVHTFRQYDIHVHGMFVLGSDEDDVATIRRTVRFAKRHQIGSIQLLTLTPIPGTPLTRRLEEEGRVISHNWQLYDGFHVLIQPARMTALRLQRETIKAMTRFYSSWNTFWFAVERALIDLPDLTRLLWRERRFSIQLPRIALMAIFPEKRTQIARIAQQTLSTPALETIQRKFGTVAVRIYGREQIKKFARQAYSMDYVRGLRELVTNGGRRRRRQQTT
jgi:radical SAM superfamily enzyme YgiQ (UPF0313 family)